MMYNSKEGEIYMKKTILALVFVLMVSTCVALPRVHYKQIEFKEKDISVPAARKETYAETTCDATIQTTTQAPAEEAYAVIVTQAPAGNTSSPKSYSYEPVEKAPNATPSGTFAVNGVNINIGDDISAVKAILGEPVNTIYVPIEYSEDEYDTPYEPVTNAEGETETTTEKPLARADDNAYGYDGFTIYTGDNKLVERVDVTDPNIETTKGIRPIGMSVFSLADSYGGPVAVEGDIYKFASGGNAYMYFDAPAGVVASWGIIKR